MPEETRITGTKPGRPDYQTVAHRVSIESFRRDQELAYGIVVGTIPAGRTCVWSLAVPSGWIIYFRRMWATSEESFPMEVAFGKEGAIYARNHGARSVAIEVPAGYDVREDQTCQIDVTNLDTADHYIYLNYNGIAEAIR